MMDSPEHTSLPADVEQKLKWNYTQDYLKQRVHTKESPKYAVLSYSTENIGDDIQTLAAIHFLKKKGIKEYDFIDREALADYRGKPVVLILNGWFMHDLDQFPPPKQVTPIFISFHVHKEELIRRNVNYFKKHAPIGCRDTATVKLFHSYNIDAYFTGCLTLYFDVNDASTRNGQKFLVDINTNPKCKHIPKVDFDKRDYSDFTEKEHDVDLDPIPSTTDRLKMAEELLNDYRRAEFVITTRLHCILPCRAFNTPAVFIHANYNEDPRFAGLRGVIHGDTKNHQDNGSHREDLMKIRAGFDAFQL